MTPRTLLLLALLLGCSSPEPGMPDAPASPPRSSGTTAAPAPAAAPTLQLKRPGGEEVRPVTAALPGSPSSLSVTPPIPAPPADLEAAAAALRQALIAKAPGELDLPRVLALPGAAQLLPALAAEPEELRVRVGATAALAATDAGRSPTLALLLDTKAPRRLRTAALQGLRADALGRDAELLAAVGTLLRDPDGAVGFLAVSRLGAVPQARPLLLAALEDPGVHPKVQLALRLATRQP